MVEPSKEAVASGTRNETNQLRELAGGNFFSRSVQLSRIASYMVTNAKQTSNIVRLSRFLENEGVETASWYDPHARGVVSQLTSAGAEIRLLVDGSKVGATHQLLMVSVAYRRRALPLAWTWVKHKRGHSSVKQQQHLLARVRTLIPEGAEVSFVGDSEFGNPKLLELLDAWGWRYALRQSGTELYSVGDGSWHKLNKVLTEGDSIDVGLVQLTKVYGYATRVIAHWQAGEKQPWFLATNYPDKRSCLKAYRYRMWTEEMFGDFKGHGFNLEATRLRSADKLDRLTLAVCLLY